MTRTDPLLTAQQAGEYLNCSPGLLYKLSGNGQLPAVRIGSLLRWPQSALDEYIAR